MAAEEREGWAALAVEGALRSAQTGRFGLARSIEKTSEDRAGTLNNHGSVVGWLAHWLANWLAGWLASLQS